MGAISRGTKFLVVTAVTALLVGAIGAGTALANAQVVAAPTAVQHLTYLGTVDMKSLSRAPSSAQGKPRAGSVLRLKSARPQSGAAVPNPNPTPTPLVLNPGTASGFIGLTAPDNGRLNGTDVEPPDQGLCAHNGTAMEMVNLAVGVYSTNGVIQSYPVSLNSFFGEPPVFGNNGTYGPFLSDPRCYYDAQTQRWFATVLEINVNP